jgi:hypothetical protein|tara:strand:+ start:603 stop:977 length:375 start_codon:yes stop_codon:yes gene_type:complete
MLILPNQAGVALGLLAFAVASLVSIFSGVSLEIAVLRGGIAFLVFLLLGWLLAYLIYEQEMPESKMKEDEKEEIIAPVAGPIATPVDAASHAPMTEPVAASGAAGGPTGALDDHGLEAPDDSDF